MRAEGGDPTGDRLRAVTAAGATVPRRSCATAFVSVRPRGAEEADKKENIAFLCSPRQGLRQARPINQTAGGRERAANAAQGRAGQTAQQRGQTRIGIAPKNRLTRPQGAVALRAIRGHGRNAPAKGGRR